MKALKTILPSILLILLGLAIGILLIVDAEQMTEFVFRLFGVALLLMALIMAIRYLSARKRGEESTGTLFSAIVSFVLGLVLAIGAKLIVQAGTTLCAIFYGAVMVANGILKISQYISLKKQKAAVSALLIVSGLLSVALGVVTLVFCSQALKVIGLIIGISLIVESILDFISLILGHRKTRTLSLYDTSGDDSDYDLE